ncbi:MAG: MarR family winged helix-turn-helix transcriptional regulator [Bacteroidota bacterium]
MNYELLQHLIQEVAVFEAEHGTGDIGTFSSWLVGRTTGKERPVEAEGHYNLNEIIASFLGQMEAYNKHYTKKVLRESQLAGQNDYVFLIILERLGDQRKTDLISLALMEVSSGIEVIRRLLRIGLIEDYPDPHDRRSKRVRLTTAGRQILADLRPGMDNIGELVTGNLTEREKNQLARILQKLAVYHKKIWQQDQDADLTDLLERYRP